MKDSGIGWCHNTWNPWQGCHHVSAECDDCYAETFLTNKGKDFKIVDLTQTWNDPYRWNAEAGPEGRCSFVFASSMTDFFHKDADRWRETAWRVIRDCRNLIWLVLTKRPERIVKHLPSDWNDGKNYPHVWLGTTCGVRESYKRVDILREIQCALRFLSIEPLTEELRDLNLKGIGWLLVGGMSGELCEKRHMDLQWAARLYDASVKANIPYLFKQVSAKKSEWGINALGLYLAERDGKKPKPDTVDIVRRFPKTPLTLMPHDIEKGRKFTEKEWSKYKQKWAAEFQ